MDYTEVRLYTDQDSLDLLSCILTDMGIGVIVEDPRDIEDLIHKKQDYEWDYIDKSFLVTAKNTPRILFYLEDTLEGLEKMEDIFREIEILPIEKVEIKSVCDEDWKNLWKKYFKPVKISDRIVVKPTCGTEGGPGYRNRSGNGFWYRKSSYHHPLYQIIGKIPGTGSGSGAGYRMRFRYIIHWGRFIGGKGCLGG